MKTIENIKVEKTFYKQEKDTLGNITRVPYEQKVTRNLNLVSPGVRFGYYLIDLVFYYIFSVALIIGVSVISYENQALANFMFKYGTFIPYFLFLFYYLLSEYLIGTTLGKLICGYTVINIYANKPSFGHIALRSIIRFIPFEAFSSFEERAWHDKWSKTYVVKRKEQEELRKLLKTNVEHQDILD